MAESDHFRMHINQDIKQHLKRMLLWGPFCKRREELKLLGYGLAERNQQALIDVGYEGIAVMMRGRTTPMVQPATLTEEAANLNDRVKDEVQETTAAAWKRLFEGTAGKKASRRDMLDWVARNIEREATEIDLESAPSQEAVNWLKHLQGSDESKAEFWDKFRDACAKDKDEQGPDESEEVADESTMSVLATIEKLQKVGAK